MTAADRAPMVEAEYEVVVTAEATARRRGLSVVGETHPIEAAIALLGFAPKGTFDAKNPIPFVIG